MRRAIPMIGRAFGRLMVLREAPDSTPRDKKWIVRCSHCGEESARLGANLRRILRGASLGCYCTGRPNEKHGLWAHPAYKTWEGMMRRCSVPSHPAFFRYGGRGIGVCPEWQDPSVFIAWATSKGWRKGLQVDRIDNDKGYSPENCRLVAAIENMNNRSNCRHLIVAGVEMTVAQASRTFGVGKTTIKERLNRGWSDEEAVRPV